VTSNNLDRAGTREILFKRLWHLAAAVPAELIRGQPLSELAGRTLAVAARREVLDIPTVLLPEAGRLLAGYGPRLAEWSTAADLPFREAMDAAMGGNSARALAQAFERRAVATPSAAPGAEVDSAVRAIAGALAWLANDPTVAEQGGDFGPASLAGLFGERPSTWGAWRNEARQILGLVRAGTPARALAWWREPRKARIAVSLLRLHGAHAAQRAGEPDLASELLAKGSAVLAPIDRQQATAPIPANDFVTRWLTLRAQLADAFWRTIRLGDPLAKPVLDPAADSTAVASS
jgi:hypothetical protein